MKKRIAILGGGPSGLFMYKRLIESGDKELIVHIFEAAEQLGSGMPYSSAGANPEHITNVSGNEIPQLVSSTTEWLATLSEDTLAGYNLTHDSLSEYSVFPRLLFGQYLNAQFYLLHQQAEKTGIITDISLESPVSDITDHPDTGMVSVEINHQKVFEFELVIICTGHNWPLIHEGDVPGYFDSPYPPSKLALRLDHAIAIRGSSLTAIDAIRTLARHNGTFTRDEPHKLSFQPHADAKNFKIVLHSRHGLLPAVRFHLDDPHLSKASLLSKEDIAAHMSSNDGFLSLDFIFEKDFKDSFIEKDPAFYARIKDLNLEEFVEMMMSQREDADPFQFFQGEYNEAKKSFRRKESIYWKEMLAILSFAMNYPAKHLSAEDMQRLQEVLMPLISIVIAFVPQNSCEELLALHDAGRLELFSVGRKSRVEIVAGGGVNYHLTTEKGKERKTYYKTFVDCIGQRHLTLDSFPFPSLVRNGTVSPALLKFRSAGEARAQRAGGNNEIEAGPGNDFYLPVPGIAVTDHFRVRDRNGASNPRIYVMAVPYMGGYNPDYSGLDFCEEASKIIAEDLVNNLQLSH